MISCGRVIIHYLIIIQKFIQNLLNHKNEVPVRNFRIMKVEVVVLKPMRVHGDEKTSNQVCLA